MAVDMWRGAPQEIAQNLKESLHPLQKEFQFPIWKQVKAERGNTEIDVYTHTHINICKLKKKILICLT